MRSRIFYFLVNSGLVLIFILKVYRKKILFHFIEKKYVQFVICIFLLKSMYYLMFWKFFSAENLKTTLSTSLSKFSSKIYLSRIFNYKFSILKLYLPRGALNLVCVLSTFFSFFFIFSFSISIFLTDTNDSTASI